MAKSNKNHKTILLILIVVIILIFIFVLYSKTTKKEHFSDLPDGCKNMNTWAKNFMWQSCDKLKEWATTSDDKMINREKLLNKVSDYFDKKRRESADECLKSCGI